MIIQPNQQKTPLQTFGEFGLIKHLTSEFILKNKTSVMGIGDDAAVLNYNDREVLVSTDMLVEGIHFDLTYVPLKHLGYKAAVVNFSDIYAMNGQPEQILVSLACSSRFPVEALEQIYEGLTHACNEYKVDLVGGDTASSKAGLIISITAIGSVKPGCAVLRSGAKKGDLLVVSGDLGGAYVGLQLLEREKSVFLDHPETQPDLEGNDYILQRQLKPEARRDVIELLAEQDILPSSMIDISDGLSSEILHLCKNSKLGCRLYEEKIPIDPTTYNMAREFGMDPTTCAMNGGEDYELLFTIRQEDYDKIKNSALLTTIGYMDEPENGAMMIDKSGGLHPIVAQGWNAFEENNTSDK